MLHSIDCMKSNLWESRCVRRRDESDTSLCEVTMLSSIGVSNLSLTRPWASPLPRMRRRWEVAEGHTQSDPSAKLGTSGRFTGARRNLGSIRAASLLEWGHSLPVRSITMARQPQPSILEHHKTTAVAPAAGCVDHCPLCDECDTLSRMLPTSSTGCFCNRDGLVGPQGRMMYPSSIIQRMTA
jgi:hypothetical protein